MRRALTLGGAVLVVVALLTSPPARPSARAGWARDLFGPFARLAHDIQWIRYQRAHLAGDEELAIEHATLALELDPGSTDGWRMLAQHLAVFLGSKERTPDLDARRGWFEAGLATAERGEERVAHPEELALWRGITLLARSELDPDVDPEGALGLLRRAARAFDQAAELGHPSGAELADYARELSATAE